MNATLPQNHAATNNQTEGSDSHDLLLREVRYRCSYRSTLELDTICRSLLPHIDGMDTDELRAIRDLLLNKEGDLMSWLVEGKEAPNEWSLTVAMIRYLFKQSKHVK